jgi:hypothetical protein
MENNDSVKCEHKYHSGGHGIGSGVYGMAFIGALVYYIQNADTFVMGLLGVLKAIVWPAMVVYKLLEFLKM